MSKDLETWEGSGLDENGDLPWERGYTGAFDDDDDNDDYYVYEDEDDS